MYSKAFSTVLVSLILLSTCILQVLGYTLGIRQDTHVTGVSVWTSVAVYDDNVDTSTFTGDQLYGLAQKAFAEMREDQMTRVPVIGGRFRPNVMAAFAIGNLVYFASSLKGDHYIMAPSRAGTVVAGKLRQCQAGLQADREAGAELQPGQQVTIHKNKAQCGEVLALHLQETDTSPNKPNFATASKQIAAYGGNKVENAVPMACCGDPNPGQAVDLTSWGCKQFMQSQAVDIFPAIAVADTALPPVEPVSIRYVPLC